MYARQTWVLMLMSAALATGCPSPEQQSSIKLQGTVEVGDYAEHLGVSGGLGTVQVPDEVKRHLPQGVGALFPTYLVKIVAKNAGTASFEYDNVEASFAVPAGQRLQVSSADGDSGQLEGGKEVEFEFDTNGYTSDLLRDSGEGIIYFELRFSHNGRIVAGPFRAPMPRFGPVFKMGDRQHLTFGNAQ